MADIQVNYAITMNPELGVGVFANGFRILHDNGAEWFLDFLVCSRESQQASVVCRVRVLEPMIGSIKERLSKTMEMITSTPDTTQTQPVFDGTVN